MNGEEVCRTCLRSGGILSPLFASTLTKVGLEPVLVGDLLKVFIKIQITYEDGFPNRICSDCLDEVKRLYCFKLKCQRSEAILNQLKGVKIKLKKLKDFPRKLEYDNGKTCTSYKELNLNISQIENEYSECLEKKNEYEKGDTYWLKSTRVDNQLDSSIRDIVKSEKFKEDGQLEQDNLLTELLDPMACANNVTQVIDSVIEEIKQEPELHIVMDETDFSEIDMETSEPNDQSISDIFRCPVCPYKCLNSVILNKHVIDNHIEMQFCKICNEEFECTAVQHCSKHISNIYTMNASTSANKIDNRCQIFKSLLNTNFRSDTRYSFLFKCSICLKSFRQKQTLQRHMRNIHDILQSTKKEDLQCSICSESFEYKSNLLIHMGLHVGEHFKCHICSQTFRYKHDLKTHLAVIHANTSKYIKSFKCEICLKTFRQKEGLKCHLQKTHAILESMEKDGLRCSICSKNFRHRINLEIHMRSHTKEKPLKCTICSKAYRYTPDLQHHMQTIHDQLQCSKCSKVFRSNNAFNSHMRGHRNTNEKRIKCDICLRTLPNIEWLKYHLRTSHDIPESTKKQDSQCSVFLETCGDIYTLAVHMQGQQKRYAGNPKNILRCDICSESFTCESNLISHLRSHTEEKPFKCEACSDTFRYKITFKNHMRTKHELEFM